MYEHFVHNFLENLYRNYFLGHIVALDQMHHLSPFATPGKNDKLIEISQNYLVIFNENRNAPDFECP
jgi:hypothetical protein